MKNIIEIISELDKTIRTHFYPERKPSTPAGNAAVNWLQTDIEDILANKNIDRAEALKYINQTFENTGRKEEILTYIDLDKALNAANIRSDFASALKQIKKGSDLSGTLDYGFSDKDITNLAKLHKANRYRRKIEDLLEDCNFHTECYDFTEGNYEEYL